MDCLLLLSDSTLLLRQVREAITNTTCKDTHTSEHWILVTKYYQANIHIKPLLQDYSFLPPPPADEERIKAIFIISSNFEDSDKYYSYWSSILANTTAESKVIILPSALSWNQQERFQTWLIENQAECILLDQPDAKMEIYNALCIASWNTNSFLISKTNDNEDFGEFTDTAVIDDLDNDSDKGDNEDPFLLLMDQLVHFKANSSHLDDLERRERASDLMSKISALTE